MTRPAGVTPRGFPYPGSANIHANTPAALQALAEAISGQLSSVGAGVVFDFYGGNVTVSSNLITLSPAVIFPRLQTVNGLTGNLGVSGVPGYGCYLSGQPGASGDLQLQVQNTDFRGPAGAFGTKYSGPAWVNLLAWGPMR